MNASELQFCRRMAKAIAKQFGPNCEIMVCDLTAEDPEFTVAVLENGHVSGGLSPAALKALRSDPQRLEDRAAVLTRTEDGRLLKSSTICLRDGEGRATGLFVINFDVSQLAAAENALRELLGVKRTLEPAARTVSELLEELLEESAQKVGKPVSEMGKEDKIAAIRFLNDRGAFLISKSGPRACEYFGISKYTLYSYIDQVKQDKV